MEGSSTSSGVVLVLLSSLNQKKSPKCSLLLSSKPYFSNFPRPNWREKKNLNNRAPSFSDYDNLSNGKG